MNLQHYDVDGNLLWESSRDRVRSRRDAMSPWSERETTEEEKKYHDREDALFRIESNEATIDQRLSTIRDQLNSSVTDAKEYASTTPTPFNSSANAATRLTELEKAVSDLRSEVRKAARRDIRFARALQFIVRKIYRSFNEIEADDGSS